MDYDPALALAHHVMPESEAQKLARDRYGLLATATRLATEKDDTFRLAGRAPFVDDVTAANWTATGIAAHESALRGGQRVAVPSFD